MAEFSPAEVRKQTTKVTPAVAFQKKGNTPFSGNHDQDVKVNAPNSVHNFSDIKTKFHEVKNKTCGYTFANKSYCPFGGACHTCPVRVQAKLKVNRPGDKYEQEADRIAESIMSAPVQDIQRKDCSACDDDKEQKVVQTKPISQQISPLIQRQAEEDEEDEKIQTKPISQQITPVIQRQAEDDEEDEPIQTKQMGVHRPVVNDSMANGINNSRGFGTKLPANTQRFMEGRFGTDFSNVRIHDDSHSAGLNSQLNAWAFTLGSDIYFNRGHYRPDEPEGKKLLAHELTHVVQQSKIKLTVQRYTQFSTADQSADKSLGWKHPSMTNIRVSDDGFMVVEDKGWNPGTNKKAWTTKSLIKKSNDELKVAGSRVKFAEKTGTLTGKAPANKKGKRRTLVEIEPKKAVGSGTFSLASDCGEACRQVIGSGTKDVAVLRSGGSEKYTSGRSYHGGTPTTPEEFFEDILKREFGNGFTRAELYQKYSNLSAKKKKLFDRKYGINKFAVPKVGEGQTISTESDMPGFTPGPDDWNFHYAATVFRSGHDHVTLESAAGWGLTDWIFYMYGPAKKSQSFHEEHGSVIGGHGSHHTTMVVQSEKKLKGTTNTPSVYLVRNPKKWATTKIVTLTLSTELYTIMIKDSWRKVKVVSGPNIGKTGWIMNKFFKY